MNDPTREHPNRGHSEGGWASGGGASTSLELLLTNPFDGDGQGATYNSGNGFGTGPSGDTYGGGFSYV